MQNAKRVRDIMSTLVYSVAEADSIGAALDLMRRHHIRHLCVLDGAEVVGIVSDRDLHALLPSPLEADAASRYAAALHDVPVRVAMTRGPASVAASATVRQAATEMLTHRIGCLPVLEGGRLVGILTRSDCLALMADATSGEVAAAPTLLRSVGE